MNTPEFFKQVLGGEVVVKLWNGKEVIGFLEALDGSLNVALRDGSGIVFIRGNSVLYLCKSESKTLYHIPQ
jgi:small nuclear ribonucleoprotein (snRNP)-like protein